ncbi:MAG: hypothetical protein R3F20_08070 [Planctomycetota bacterium]
MTRILASLALVLALGPLAAAQGEKVDAAQIGVLLDFGYETPEIVEALGAPGREISLVAGDLEALEKKGADAALIAFLKPHAPAPKARPGLTLAAILERWRKDGDADALLAEVEASGGGYDLSVEDMLEISRARLPYSIVRAMKRKSPPKAPEKPVRPTVLTLDAIVRMVHDGATEDAVLARLREETGTFPVDTDAILRLEREGVPLSVLRELYARRTRQAPPTEEVAAGTLTRRENAPVDPAASAAPMSFEVYAPRGGGFSILSPAGFVRSERFTGRKMLVQMVDPNAAEREDLPDLEFSILVARSREGERGSLTPENLEPVARKIMDGLTAGFRQDGIVFIAKSPETGYLAGRPALRFATAATTASGTGHVGASHVVFGEDGVIVVSYSSRTELADLWRERLETCARSLALGTARPVADAAADLVEPGPLGRSRHLFRVWKDSLQRFDWASYASTLEKGIDPVATRRTFVERALELARRRNRIELGAIDIEAGEIQYKVFGLEGKTTGRLGLVKTEGEITALREN